MNSYKFKNLVRIILAVVVGIWVVYSPNALNGVLFGVLLSGVIRVGVGYDRCRACSEKNTTK